MANYFDKDGNYINVENLSLADIYHRAFALGVESVAVRPQGEWNPIKTRKLTEEEKEEYPNCDFAYDCKLPNDDEQVLVTTRGGYVTLDTFCRNDGCYFEYLCDEGDVIAWMPLPDPYRKEGAE